MITLDYFKSILRQHKFRATPSRIALLSMLEKSATPLSVVDMQKKLGRTKPDQATFYRMIKDLKDAGILDQIHIEHNHAHYELKKDHHHHAICTNCGKIADISKCDIGALEKEIKNKTGFASIDRHSLEFFGICNTCAKKLKK